MMLLALDTSTRTVGVALYDGEQVLSEVAWVSKDYHTAELAPVVAEVLARPGVKPSELGALAIAAGPGSFTGLRVGMSLAKGLALANHLALVGVPTLDALAAAQPIQDLPMAAILRLGRGRLAVGWYQALEGAWQPSGELEALTPLELAQGIQQPTLVCGELTADERRLLARKRKNVLLASPAQSMRRPAFLAEIGWQRWQAGKVDDPAVLAPTYLHYGEPVPG
jgi:tRNA threonylcarbamoyladenosine biosynthesis protein TsaB